jgi:hypothetical protein
MNKISPYFFAVCVALSSIACGSAIKPVATPDHNYDVRQAQDVGGITVFYKVPRTAEKPATKKPAAKKTPAIFGEMVIDLSATTVDKVDADELAQSTDEELDCSVEVVRAGSGIVLARYRNIIEAQQFAHENLRTMVCDDTSCIKMMSIEMHLDERCPVTYEDMLASAE